MIQKIGFRGRLKRITVDTVITTLPRPQAFKKRL